MPHRERWGSLLRLLLILAQRSEPEVDVRTAPLCALDLATAPHEAAGHG